MRRRRENFEFYDITNRISSAKTVFLKAFWSVFGVETHGNISKFSASGQDYDLKFSSRDLQKLSELADVE